MEWVGIFGDVTFCFEVKRENVMLLLVGGSLFNVFFLHPYLGDDPICYVWFPMFRSCIPNCYLLEILNISS